MEAPSRSRDPAALQGENDMKFMVMHKHDEIAEAGQRPSPEFIAAMGELVGGMARAGKLLDGEGLGASKTRTRVSFRRGERTVVHGPFTGSNELPAGFAKITVRSRDEAVAAATKIGAAIGGDVELEVGKLHEAWDLGIGDKPADAPERYLITYKATPSSEAGRAPDLDAVWKELREAGVLTASAALTPSSQGKRLTWHNGQRSIVDGPFSESKELIGGYALLDFASMDECLAFCEQYATLMLTAADRLEIDVRPLVIGA
jgi:hypothetical protein